ncbi:hypothetical protein Back2_14020 [Nocardioides baekrokdamisoli]|uniref:Glycosyltransferase 2-like domain-containing protein n=1 Tax=Nocardioides baekrokdamisoli TaxID=1804624 RepID=A0A3G9IM78_9ACTN|nr:glycosyltransferase family 2 protein [Nocardioides baekrokdamisoli]BBH17115.1 hypothetical protein Back2_14020 [Nocardioides baekrokdamisoli]
MNWADADEPTVSIITVTFNSRAALLEYWSGWDGSAEWIVVDNASTDDSAQVARDLGARVIRLETNLGFSGANNVGARAASGSVLGFVNPDVAIQQPAVRALAERAAGGRRLVAPQLVNVDGSPQENGRGAPYPHRKLAHMFRPSSRANQKYSRVISSGIENVVWVMGAAVFATREVFDEIGGWNEQFFIYYEDSDICLRALNKGIRTEVLGDVKVTHGWSRATVHERSSAIWKIEFSSAVKFYASHPYCLIPIGPRGRTMREADRAVGGGPRVS